MNIDEQRTQFNVKDDVYILVKLGDQLTKKRPAKVVEVLRGVCRVIANNEKVPRIVRFKDLELKSKDETVVAPLAPSAPTLDKLMFPVEELATNVPPPPVEPEKPAFLSSLDAWMKMGEDLLEEQELEMLMLDDEENAVKVEQKELEEEIATLQKTLAELPKRLETLPTRRAALQKNINLIKGRLGR